MFGKWSERRIAVKLVNLAAFLRVTSGPVALGVGSPAIAVPTFFFTSKLFRRNNLQVLGCYDSWLSIMVCS